MYPQNWTPLQAIVIDSKILSNFAFTYSFISCLYPKHMQTNKWFSYFIFDRILFWLWIFLIGLFKTLPGPYSFISDLNPWPLVTSACAFLCAVFQTKTTISQWLLSELFFGQISGSCVTNFSILPISICTSHSPSSRYSQDSPGSATAGAAQD